MIIIHNTLEDGYDYFTTDKWGIDYHFKISTFQVPSGYESEAVQVIKEQKGRTEPYIFQVLDSFNADFESLELRLKAKIKKGINRRYLETRDGKSVIGSDLTLAGRIEYSNLPDTSFQNVLVIDGKRITLEQFSEMLQMFEGFNFKFSIHDPSDELPE